MKVPQRIDERDRLFMRLLVTGLHTNPEAAEMASIPVSRGRSLQHNEQFTQELEALRKQLNEAVVEKAATDIVEYVEEHIKRAREALPEVWELRRRIMDETREEPSKLALECARDIEKMAGAIPKDVAPTREVVILTREAEEVLKRVEGEVESEVEDAP